MSINFKIHVQSTSEYEMSEIGTVPKSEIPISDAKLCLKSEPNKIDHFILKNLYIKWSRLVPFKLNLSSDFRQFHSQTASGNGS